MSNMLPTTYQQFIHKSRYARWLDDEQRREEQLPLLGPLLLWIQRIGDDDDQEDERHHAVRREHGEARHRDCWSGQRHGRVAEPPQARGLRHRHRRRLPLLGHRPAPREEVGARAAGGSLTILIQARGAAS